MPHAASSSFSSHLSICYFLFLVQLPFSSKRHTAVSPSLALLSPDFLHHQSLPHLPSQRWSPPPRSCSERRPTAPVLLQSTISAPPLRHLSPVPATALARPFPGATSSSTQLRRLPLPLGASTASTPLLPTSPSFRSASHGAFFVPYSNHAVPTFTLTTGHHRHRPTPPLARSLAGSHLFQALLLPYPSDTIFFHPGIPTSYSTAPAQPYPAWSPPHARPLLPPPSLSRFGAQSSPSPTARPPPHESSSPPPIAPPPSASLPRAIASSFTLVPQASHHYTSLSLCIFDIFSLPLL